MTLSDEDVHLTPREIAEREHISIDTVKRALKAGHLHGHKIGARGDWRISVADYKKWIVSGARIRPAKRNTHKPPKEEQRA